MTQVQNIHTSQAVDTKDLQLGKKVSLSDGLNALANEVSTGAIKNDEQLKGMMSILDLISQLVGDNKAYFDA